MARLFHPPWFRDGCVTPAILLRFKPTTSTAAIWKKKLFSFVAWNIEGHNLESIFLGTKATKRKVQPRDGERPIPGNTVSP